MGLVHEEGDALALAFRNFDDAVEVLLGIGFSCLHLPDDDIVICFVFVLVKRGGKLPDFEGTQEAVVDALPE
jgi:hypothetical protein